MTQAVALGGRSELHIDLESQSRGDSLQGREGRANATRLKTINSSLARPHTTSELTLAQTGRLSRCMNTLAYFCGQLSFGESAVILVAFISGHGAELLRLQVFPTSPGHVPRLICL